MAKNEQLIGQYDAHFFLITSLIIGGHLVAVNQRTKICSVSALLSPSRSICLMHWHKKRFTSQVRGLLSANYF